MIQRRAGLIDSATNEQMQSDALDANGQLLVAQLRKRWRAKKPAS
jgi:hypothetical protein